MGRAEFDEYAKEYNALLQQSIGASGEGPEYFARYKIEDMAAVWRKTHGETPAERILDFGGGVGTSLRDLSDLFPETDITLTDVSEESLKLASQQAVPRVDIKVYDGQSLPFEDGSFDMVLAACVFHHIPEEQHVSLMSEIHRVLRPDGLFFVFEHNPWNPLTVRAVNTCEFDENAVLITGPELKRRMHKAGFKMANVAWRLFVPGWFRVLRPLEHWLTWLPLGAQYRATGTK